MNTVLRHCAARGSRRCSLAFAVAALVAARAGATETVIIDDALQDRTTGEVFGAGFSGRVWLGSAPGHAGKYENELPGIPYRNFNLVALRTLAISTKLVPAAPR